MNIEDITKKFVLDNLGKIVWLGDDYLSMRYYSDCRKTLDILEKVVEIKKELREDGVTLSH